MQKIIEIYLLKNSKRNSFGLLACSHGANYGSYDVYRYGIKNLFSISIHFNRGEFIVNNLKQYYDIQKTTFKNYIPNFYVAI
jgi:hypothetical protein